ncbi:MAG: hypothetical protein ICV80_20015 [Microcoleus sp. T1-bin1]|nr:hypothetical protein [Microcoleus sp. T1-bin1]
MYPRLGRAAAGSLDEPVELSARRIDRPIVKPIDSKEIVPGVRDPAISKSTSSRNLEKYDRP